MKTEVLYLILDQLGHSSLVRDQGTKSVSLSDLLAEGWRPVRETPLGPHVLILLERESEETFGFGFSKS